MSRILDYAAPPPPTGQILRQIAATIPLWLGLIGYAILCVPAATQRGYPPIDPVWDGVTYLWVFPIPLFALCWPGGRFSKKVLLIYAIISGYIDACTVVMMTPHRFSFIEPVFNSVFHVPIHLLGVLAIAWLSRFVIRICKPREEGSPSAAYRVGGIAACVVIVAIAAGFPFVFERFAFIRMDQAGRNRAESDWANHTAVMMVTSGWYTEHHVGEVMIGSYFDLETGLQLKGEMHMGFEPAYQKRIGELLQLHGVPDWSQKSHLVNDADLISMLTAKGMTPVTTFPYDAAPGIELMRNCTSTRFGGVATSGGNDLTIYAKFSGMDGFCGTTGAVCVGRLDKYPHILFVRCDQTWAAVCTDDGLILQYATKDAP